MWHRGHEADKRIYVHILPTTALEVQEVDFSKNRRELLGTDVLETFRSIPLCLKIALNISSLTRCDYMCASYFRHHLCQLSKVRICVPGVISWPYIKRAITECFWYQSFLQCFNNWNSECQKLLFFFFVTFFFFWLHWVFVAVCRLSLVAASRGYSLLRCTGFSLWWLLLLRSTGSRCAGFSSCGSWALERSLSSCGAWA